MAKKSILERQKKREIVFLKLQKKREFLSRIIKEEKNIEKKLEYSYLLQKLNRNSSKTRLRARCWLSGRSRGIYSFFGLQKMALRMHAYKSLLPGLIKSSW